MAISAALTIGAAPLGSLDVGIDGFRSSRGLVQVCLTTDPAHYPDCSGDPAARRVTVPAAHAAALNFGDLPSGDYAIALVHDENGNGKLDTFAGIPREGIGFSRNPALAFGPPRFKSAQFPVATGETGQRVRVRYFL